MLVPIVTVCECQLLMVHDKTESNVYSVLLNACTVYVGVHVTFCMCRKF